MSADHDLQFPSLAGDGLAVVGLSGDDLFSLALLKGTGERVELENVTLTDLRRLSNRIKEAMDLFKEIKQRKLEGLFRPRS